MDSEPKNEPNEAEAAQDTIDDAQNGTNIEVTTDARAEGFAEPEDTNATSEQDVQAIEDTPEVEAEPATGENITADTPEKPVADYGTLDSATAPQPLTIASKPQPTKKKWLGTIIAVILAVLVLGGAASAYAFWYQNPDKIVNDALTNLMSTKQLQTKTAITSDSDLGLGSAVSVKLKNLTLDTNFGEKSGSSLDANLTLEVGGRDYSLGAKAIATDTAIYFQINNVKDLVEKYLKDAAGGSYNLSSSAAASLAKLQDKWVKVDVDANSGNRAYTCTSDVFSEFSGNKAMQKQISDVYKKHPFLKVGDKVGSKDGSLGYNVTIDKDVARAFTNDAKNTDLAKKLKDCDKSTTVDSTDTTIDSATDGIDSGKTEVVVWVSRWTHKLTAVDFNVETKNTTNGTDMKLNTHTELKYDAPAKVTVPADSESIDQWTNDLRDFMIDMFYGGASASTVSTLD